MSHPKVLGTLFLFLLAATAAHAQWTRVLLPVYFEGEVAGAYGSRWTLELTGFNAAQTQHLLVPDPEVKFDVPSRCGCTVSPLELFDASRFLPSERQSVGRFLYVLTNGPQDTDRLTLSLRTRDVSREAEGFGTQVPVVRERDTSDRPIALTNIPIGPLYRQKLRIYDFDGEVGHSVEVEIHDAIGSALRTPLATRSFRFAHDVGTPYPKVPGYVELDLDTMPELAGASSAS